MNDKPSQPAGAAATTDNGPAPKSKGRITAFDRQVAQNLQRLRSVSGLSQSQVAEALGVSFQQVQKYESGANRLPLEKFYLLSQLFSVPQSYFFHGIEEAGAGQSPLMKCDPELLRLCRKISALPDRSLRNKITRTIHVLAST